MQITVTGKQIDVGEALRVHVEDNLVAAVSKYFDRPVDANVVFSRRGHEFTCDSSVHLPTGLTAQAHAASNDIYVAFEQATDRIEKQLRRHKRRLKDHHKARGQQPIEMVEAAGYVLRGYGEAEETEETEAAAGPDAATPDAATPDAATPGAATPDAADSDAADSGPDGEQPVIIAEMTMPIKTLTVGEAVMQMELAHAQFLVFRNDASGRINIVYQREDGHVGWIDPANLPQS